MADPDTSNDKMVAEIIDQVRRTMVHYGLWFAGTMNELGLTAAIAAEREAGDRFQQIVLTRLKRVLGADAEAGLAGLDPQTLVKLREALAVNWLAQDGVWFQAVEGIPAEQGGGMVTAKAVNDSCWSAFSPFEAARIKALYEEALAELPENNPLEILKAALGLRLYARINEQEFGEQEIVDGQLKAFTFRMNRCRVQDARKRKGLADYPCKSGGMVEYTEFARAIHPDIKTTCIACPPDDHPEEWYCAWRFELP